MVTRRVSEDEAPKDLTQLHPRSRVGLRSTNGIYAEPAALDRVFPTSRSLDQEETAMRRPAQREQKKPKTAADKGKRYRCCVCRKRSPRKTTQVPYYCAEHAYLADLNDDETNDD